MLVSEVPSGEAEEFDEAGLQHVLSQAQAASIVRRTHLAILPLFCFICAACYIDRTNLAFASMHLNEDLNFTPEGEHPPHTCKHEGLRPSGFGVETVFQARKLGGPSPT